jgi:hypothetical protein
MNDDDMNDDELLQEVIDALDELACGLPPDDLAHDELRFLREYQSMRTTVPTQAVGSVALPVPEGWPLGTLNGPTDPTNGAT